MSLFDDRSHAGREMSKFLQNKAEIDVVVIPYVGAFEIGLENSQAGAENLVRRIFLVKPFYS